MLRGSPGFNRFGASMAATASCVLSRIVGPQPGIAMRGMMVGMGGVGSGCKRCRAPLADLWAM